MDTTININPPFEIKEKHLTQIIDLIKTGGEVKTSKDDLRRFLLRADLIAYGLSNDKVICTATLKNPFASYKTKVFNKASAPSSMKFEKELGYISTHPDYEGKGHCSNLLRQFFELISDNSIYATTRKPAMIHILSKYEFSQTGKTYGTDLKLLIRHKNK